MKNTFLWIIISFHILFLSLLFFPPTFLLKSKNKKPILVKTIVPIVAAPIKTSVAAPQPIASPPKPISPKPKTPTPTPQKKEAPAIANKVVVKKPAKAPPTPPPPPRAKISDSLLKELERSIAKIDEKDSPIVQKGVKKTTPKQLSLQIDIPSLADYTPNHLEDIDLLTSTLREQLKLPEYGEVTIELTLKPQGDLVKVVVLKSKSDKNKAYLLAHLPKILFPSLNHSSQKENTFVLTFCNE